MTRLVLLVVFSIFIVIGLSLRNYQNIPVDNSKFNFDKVKKDYVAYEAEKKKLMEAHNSMYEKKVEVEEVVEEGPIVELTTPSLQRGSDLYAKCIVCHGKKGEGKKSQKSPKIAGQLDWYIESSIKKMKSGERANAVMMPYIKKLSNQDIKDLANYISKMPW